VLKLEIPGVKEEDVDIRVENQTLTVRGERKFEAEEKEENFKRIERAMAASSARSLCPLRWIRRTYWGELPRGRAQAGAEKEGFRAAPADQDRRRRLTRTTHRECGLANRSLGR
jgi:hypothetical protein